MFDIVCKIMYVKKGNIYILLKEGITMQQKPQISTQEDKVVQTTAMDVGALAAIELNRQCMTAILSSMFTIEKELAAITEILAEQVLEA